MSTQLINKIPKAPHEPTQDYSVLYFLEKAKESMAAFEERALEELEGSRSKERELSQHLTTLSQVANSNDRQLSSCKASLASMESNSREMYAREHSLELRANELEEENEGLRHRLRNFLRVEIKRLDKKSSSSHDNSRAKAVLVFKNQTIATFRTVRYLLDEAENLQVEDVLRKMKIPVTRGFDHLKLIKKNNELKLSLANQRGNQFFEHKKYDSFYTNLPEEAKVLKTSIIVSNEEQKNLIAWQDLLSKCGFWSCLVLKPSAVESKPEVWTVRDNQKVGHFSASTAYFEFGHLVVSNGREEARFSNPYLEKSAGQFFVKEMAENSASNSASKLKLDVDLGLFDVTDKAAFLDMIDGVFP